MFLDFIRVTYSLHVELCRVYIRILVGEIKLSRAPTDTIYKLELLGWSGWSLTSLIATTALVYTWRPIISKNSKLETNRLTEILDISSVDLISNRLDVVLFVTFINFTECTVANLLY